MDPEPQPETDAPPDHATKSAPHAESVALASGTLPFGTPGPGEREPNPLRWIFIGDQGLRAGWSVLISFVLFRRLFVPAFDTAFTELHWITRVGQFTVRRAFFAELAAFLAMIAAVAIIALVEHRRILDFNLRGRRRSIHFLSGLAAGFLALSLLVGELAAGSWLHFGPVALSRTAVAKYAALWGCTFLLVGCVEEGLFRCYLQFTLTRGINFWWALAIEVAICLDLVLRVKGNGVWGVYAVALVGLLPCLMLHLKAVERSGFWQAAWVTSTLFGFVHTTNNGENWIGIFAAAAIGFVFCVSIWVTGSAWWAIGCHAGWDWAETYFYGTSDSGMVATGHYLTANPAGNVLWSGGSDGPEGSLLVLGVILLLLLALLVLYGRRGVAATSAPAA